MTCQSYRITPLLFLSSLFLPFFPPFFCFFAIELNAFKLKIAFLQLDEGLYVQHKKKQQQCQQQQTTTTTIAKHIPQLACCAFRYNISSCCCSLFLLYLIKICCCQSFGQQAGGEEEETEEVAGEWKERYAHTDTQKCCYFWRT